MILALPLSEGDDPGSVHRVSLARSDAPTMTAAGTGHLEGSTHLS